jgi:hypothetical protein
MSILLKRRTNRRTVLRGLFQGAAVGVALPFLECFLNDHGTALASGAPLPVRFGTWFWGLGFTPGRAIAKTSPQIEFLDECRALDPYKHHINYFSDFNTPLDGRVAAVHFTGWVAARTGTVPLTRDILAPTLDTFIADEIGSTTRFRSLELASTGDPNDSYTFRSAGGRNTAEVSPVAFYARVFGAEFADPNKADFKPDPSVMVRQSVLSAVADESRDFVKTLGSSDRAQLDQYFTSIRQLENQLDLQTQKPAPAEACRLPPRPADGPIGVELPTVLANHESLAKLLALAVACNQTRVFNMTYSQSLSMLRRPGSAFTHHVLTHDEPVDASLGYQREVAAMNVVSMQAFATFIEAFASIREGDGTLLDNTLIFANTDTNYARYHALDGVPIMTAGRAGGRIRTGLHIVGNGDPTTRVGLTAMQAMGLPIQSWGTNSMQTSKIISEILV